MPSPKGNRNALKSEIGNIYGTLEVIEEAGRASYGPILWRCKCNCGCGRERVTSGANLRRGNTKSCQTIRLTPEELELRKTRPRKCNLCKTFKPANQFPRLERNECHPCRSRNSVRYKSSYGITLDDYNEILSNQNGKCAICEDSPDTTLRTKFLFVDHDHNIKKGKLSVRGLLCKSCNAAIGFLKEDIEIAKKLVLYLETYKKFLDTTLQE